MVPEVCCFCPPNPQSFSLSYPASPHFLSPPFAVWTERMMLKITRSTFMVSNHRAIQQTQMGNDL